MLLYLLAYNYKHISYIYCCAGAISFTTSAQFEDKQYQRQPEQLLTSMGLRAHPNEENNYYGSLFASHGAMRVTCCPHPCRSQEDVLASRRRIGFPRDARHQTPACLCGPGPLKTHTLCPIVGVASWMLPASHGQFLGISNVEKQKPTYPIDF